jgi:hypothetical protein
LHFCDTETDGKAALHYIIVALHSRMSEKTDLILKHSNDEWMPSTSPSPNPWEAPARQIRGLEQQRPHEKNPSKLFDVLA